MRFGRGHIVGTRTRGQLSRQVNLGKSWCARRFGAPIQGNVVPMKLSTCLGWIKQGQSGLLTMSHSQSPRQVIPPPVSLAAETGTQPSLAGGLQSAPPG